jgi:hypothetical protein
LFAQKLLTAQVSPVKLTTAITGTNYVWKFWYLFISQHWYTSSTANSGKLTNRTHKNSPMWQDLADLVDIHDTGEGRKSW